MQTFFRHRPATTNPGATGGNPPESLEQRLSAGPLSLAEGLRYAIGLAEALRDTHNRGRIYGGLQPGTVVIVEGRVRLLPSAPAAMSPYFSPEQVAGHDVDWRSDIFSLGAIMYEMLSGRRAFAGSSKPAVRIEILDAEPAPLENVPSSLANLVYRCLEKKPERRIQRVEILLAALKLHGILTCSPGRYSIGPRVLDSKEGKIVPSVRSDCAAPMARWMPPPPDLAPLREKVDSICPMCGTFDVYTSQPVGFWESKLVRLGVRLNRCYSCYERFLQFAGLSVRRPGPPVVWIYPDAARSPRSDTLE